MHLKTGRDFLACDVSERERERETERQTDRQTDRQRFFTMTLYSANLLKSSIVIFFKLANHAMSRHFLPLSLRNCVPITYPGAALQGSSSNTNIK